MEEISVSVLCPVYNHSKYLRKALDGFVNQKTSFAFEVIVHDDASTDDSAEIIREYEDNYPNIFRPIYQKENLTSKKISYFDKYLYPAIRGKYFAVCEGDDYWSDEYKLQRQFEALEAHPECSFSSHVVRNIHEDGAALSSTIPSVLKLTEGVLNADTLRRSMFQKEFYPFQTTSYFFRSQLIPYISTEGAEFLKLCPALDYGWILCALNLGDCYYVDQEMSCYRRNSEGSWSSRQKKKATHNSFQQRVAKSLAAYDALTDNMFHSEITRMIARNEYTSMSYRQQYAKRRDPNYAELYRSFSKRQKFFLSLCYYFPPFAPLYSKMKNVRSSQLISR